MAYEATTTPSCLSKFFGASQYNKLPLRSSSIFSTSSVAKCSAALLVLASSGLGAYYAATSGAHHGGVLAALLVLMALGLELSKPLAVSAAFDAFKSWHVVQGSALAILPMVAVTFSLTAELSLMASSRGDLVAARASQSDTATKASDRYDRAKLELLTLAPTRPKAELDQKIAGLLLTPGADGCEKIDADGDRWDRQSI